MAKIRTFICIELTEEIRQRLADLQRELKQYSADVRWVRPESIHLTLKFLGDVDERAINDIAQATEIACKGTPTFFIGIRQTGAFPNLRRPRVLWVDVDEPEGNLKSLHKKIEEELTSLGYPKEKRSFSPHLTIGRVKSLREIDKVTQKLQAMDFTAGNFQASEVVVMRSELKPSGAVYTPLLKVQLKENKK